MLVFNLFIACCFCASRAIRRSSSTKIRNWERIASESTLRNVLNVSHLFIHQSFLLCFFFSSEHFLPCSWFFSILSPQPPCAPWNIGQDSSHVIDCLWPYVGTCGSLGPQRVRERPTHHKQRRELYYDLFYNPCNTLYKPLTCLRSYSIFASFISCFLLFWFWGWLCIFWKWWKQCCFAS